MIVRVFTTTVLLLAAFAGAEAATNSEKCEAARLRLAGQRSLCLLNTEAVAILKATVPDFTRCTTKYDTKCAAVQSKYGASCPLPADCASIRTIAECSADQLPIPTTTTTTTPACNVNPSLDVDADRFTGSAGYVRSNGAPAAPAFQVGGSDSFGTNVSPLEGSRPLILSTGRARSASQPDACGSVSCPGLGAGTAPSGFPQSIPSCPTGTSVNDDVGLQLQLPCQACAEGTAELVGTGFDTYRMSPAGATSWLVTQALRDLRCRRRQFRLNRAAGRLRVDHQRIGDGGDDGRSVDRTTT
jgi:hypothetical protein